MSRTPQTGTGTSGEDARVYHCPIEVTIDLVGGRWKPLILWHLDRHGVLRNGELRRLIPTVTQKMLTQQLRQLEADGLVERTDHDEVPPRVEYRLSSEGASLQRMLEVICAWGEDRASRTGITFVDPLTGEPKTDAAARGT
jgi:DNA-binding HxlR family transcriptional regulator